MLERSIEFGMVALYPWPDNFVLIAVVAVVVADVTSVAAAQIIQ